MLVDPHLQLLFGTLTVSVYNIKLHVGEYPRFYRNCFQIRLLVKSHQAFILWDRRYFARFFRLGYHTNKLVIRSTFVRVMKFSFLKLDICFVLEVLNHLFKVLLCHGLVYRFVIPDFDYSGKS